MRPSPFLSVEFRDPDTGARGYLTIDRVVDGLAAGGIRVAPDVTWNEVNKLARAMSHKQLVAGLSVGGAKAGIALDPSHPRKRQVLRRFMLQVRETIESHWSVGPDMNTSMAELESIARAIGIPALKIAVARNRGIPDDEFLERYRLLSAQTPLGTVNELRPGTGVAAAAIVLAQHLGAHPGRIAVQGAGGLGGPTARLLHDSGQHVAAWADDRQCVLDPDVPALYEALGDRRLPAVEGAAASSAVLTTSCDVLVLAAISDAVPMELVNELGCKGIVCGANLALNADVERALHERGVVVLPDPVASSGGSLAIEALYAKKPTSARDILSHVSARMTTLARDVLDRSHADGVSPRDAAFRVAQDRPGS